MEEKRGLETNLMAKDAQAGKLSAISDDRKDAFDKLTTQMEQLINQHKMAISAKDSELQEFRAQTATSKQNETSLSAQLEQAKSDKTKEVGEKQAVINKLNDKLKVAQTEAV